MIEGTLEVQRMMERVFQSVEMDGDPLKETITEGETLEVPDGESWFIHMTTRTGQEGEVHFAYDVEDITQDQYKVMGNRDRSNNQVDLIVHEGGEFYAAQSATTLTGWVVRRE